MSSARKTVLVVGAGLAGLRACEALRSLGFDGTIVLVGDEPHRPYDRPPLSKQFLAGEWGEDRLFLRPAEMVASLELDARLGPAFAARSLDLTRRLVALSCGDAVGFDGLVIATGASPRRLPGLDELEQVHVLRTIEDAVSLRSALRTGARLLVVGAGFIGLEVAATARRLGVEVDVVDPLPAPLGRVFGEPVGRVVEHMHLDHGVRFHLGSGLARLGASADGSLLCTLADGSVVTADAVVVGIGVAPAVGWLADSGLKAGPGGVVCDASLVAAPGVVAAGDLARFPMQRLAEAAVRVEHRTTAAELGDHAARSLLSEIGARAQVGTAEPFDTVFYVWSDQYDLKMQVLGRPGPGDDVHVVEGSLEERRFVACFGSKGRLSGAASFGRPRALMRFRPLLARGATLKEALARPTC